MQEIVLDFDIETTEKLLIVSPNLVKFLKKHQADGIKFMWECCFESLKKLKTSEGTGCILAHCMGLGKSLQIISLAYTLLTNSLATEVNTVLIKAPCSTILNWVNEFNIWLERSELTGNIKIFDISMWVIYKLELKYCFDMFIIIFFNLLYVVGTNQMMSGRKL